MRYQHIFFDLDHTLWDFEANARNTLEVLYTEFALEELGVPGFDRFHSTYSAHNERLWERFRRGEIKRELLRWKRVWLTLLEFKIADEALARRFGAAFIDLLPSRKQLFPGTLEVLDYLQGKGYPLHLITNGFEETQHLKLRHAGLSAYFTHVVTSESAGSLKPHPGIFRYALELAGTRAVDAVMIGDALAVDIRGARDAGMDQIYFNPAIPAEGITPTYTINSLLELKDIL
ncbi:YjjG family noncanonical pyrimidine nucleotidase [Compostibacter hankyongensis]|uniref:YjjG family noncanonical pyrimidine nucleotidase n=1 Tax=Compostibacter hankyongensis TaxID=1007089 RepID=A0ABP8G4Q2_9BACT